MSQKTVFISIIIKIFLAGTKDFPQDHLDDKNCRLIVLKQIKKVEMQMPTS